MSGIKKFWKRLTEGSSGGEEVREKANNDKGRDFLSREEVKNEVSKQIGHLHRDLASDIARKELEGFDNCIRLIDDGGLKVARHSRGSTTGARRIFAWGWILWGSNWGVEETKAKIREWKELYRQVFAEMGLLEEEQPEEVCEIIDVGDPDHLSKEEVQNDLLKQVGWQSDKHSQSENATINLVYQDAFLDTVDEFGLEVTKDGIDDHHRIEPGIHYPIWLAKLMRSDWDLPEAKRKVREMKELYILVMREMGLLEPVSEPEAAEKVEEAQAPIDRGIERVRAAFLNKLETIDVDIGIDFFIFEEIEEEGLILIRGRAFLERPIWLEFNELVRRELGGRYDSSERGWVIEK